MPARQDAPHGAPAWIDLATPDVAHARDFYGALLGWTADEPDPRFGGYITFRKDEHPVAGARACAPGGEEGPQWYVYLASDDARKTADTALDRGGQVLVPPAEVGELGVMAFVADPGGAPVGVWQPALHRGIGVLGEAGTPSWFELHTRHYDGSLAFLRDVFGWDTRALSDTPEFRYAVLDVDGEPHAGVLDAGALLPEGAPAGWSVYFGVDDTDAALARVVDLGGAVVLPAEDTPYGRLATATDPTGATFRLVAPNDQMPAR